MSNTTAARLVTVSTRQEMSLVKYDTSDPQILQLSVLHLILQLTCTLLNNLLKH